MTVKQLAGFRMYFVSGFSTGNILRLLMLASVFVLAGCGFHLRGQVAMPFKTIYIKTETPGTPFINSLRRKLEINNVVVAESAEEANVILDIVNENSSKQVLSLGADGRVNEFRLSFHVSLRAYDLKQHEWIPAEELVQVRDLSFDDTQILAKEAEEVQLQRSMRNEMVQQIERRLAYAKPRPQ